MHLVAEIIFIFLIVYLTGSSSLGLESAFSAIFYLFTSYFITCL